MKIETDPVSIRLAAFRILVLSTGRFSCFCASTLKSRFGAWCYIWCMNKLVCSFDNLLTKYDGFLVKSLPIGMILLFVFLWQMY